MIYSVKINDKSTEKEIRKNNSNLIKNKRDLRLQERL